MRQRGREVPLHHLPTLATSVPKARPAQVTLVQRGSQLHSPSGVPTPLLSILEVGTLAGVTGWGPGPSASTPGAEEMLRADTVKCSCHTNGGPGGPLRPPRGPGCLCSSPTFHWPFNTIGWAQGGRPTAPTQDPDALAHSGLGSTDQTQNPDQNLASDSGFVSHLKDRILP